MMLTAHTTGLRHADRVAATVQESASAARSVVAASWRRSMMYHGLDPSIRRTPLRVEAPELHRARERNGRLLEIAEPTLERLFATAASAGCCVVLTDVEGLILTSNSAPGDEGDFDAWGLSAGAIWSEASEGTNGIGTCVAEKRPVIIHQDQHFRTQNTAMSCMGAPVFDHAGRMVAVLDVSSCRRDLTLSFAQVLGLVVTESARAVESDLFRTAYTGSKIVVAEGHGAGGVSLLAVDGDDLVVGATRQARKTLGLSEEALSLSPSLHEVLGAPAAVRNPHGTERSAIRRALARARGNVSAAARDLGVGRATMYRKMARYGIEA
ncbi:GAF domain-containing protein [Polymorphum gilvum]|uniref:Fis family transcriptional regulator n=1 Tax=Polymorphum gilvum (strain LMG 25793 / CGMCC 1.9160 / SL003B-26A1) TaxID=991905 RepID=F2J2W2_POLGS|nr:GAF domain-containing protein [Polymorphum gilvum]ADZ72136.1 Fis family transcriptional regulator [Polymorphum gilvum SL003B-26A1]